MKRLLTYLLVLVMTSMASADISLQVSLDGTTYFDADEFYSGSRSIWIGIYNDTAGSAGNNGQFQAFVAKEVHGHDWTGASNVYIPPNVPGATNVYIGTTVDPTKDVWYANYTNDVPTDYVGVGIMGDFEYLAYGVGVTIVTLLDGTDFTVLDTLTIQVCGPCTEIVYVFEADADGDYHVGPSEATMLDAGNSTIAVGSDVSCEYSWSIDNEVGQWQGKTVDLSYDHLVNVLGLALGWHTVELNIEAWGNYSGELLSEDSDTAGLFIFPDPAVPGDLTGNGFVDITDFAMFAAQWEKVDCGFCGGANLAPEVPDEVVNFLDLAIFVDYWLSGTP